VTAATAVAIRGGQFDVSVVTIHDRLGNGQPETGAIGRVLTGSATPEEALQSAGDRVEQTYELLTGT